MLFGTTVGSIFPTATPLLHSTARNRALTDRTIVLDLDQTLIATQDRVSDLQTLGIVSDPRLMALRQRFYHIAIDDLERPGIGTHYDFWGVFRPHAFEFLRFCYSYFERVAVWSAGKRPYVEAIVERLFIDLPPPAIVWTYDDIEFTATGEVLKPLTKMVQQYPELNLDKMWILDDNPVTFSANPSNGLLIPAYEPLPTVAGFSADDTALPKLQRWLMRPEVVAAPSTRRLDTRSIFV